MGRVINFIYGGLIVFVALDAMLFGIISMSLLQYVVITLGFLVFLTPTAPGTVRARFDWLRRRVFGSYIILSGLLPIIFSLLHYIGIYLDGSFLSRILISSFSGQLILLAIGTIYFLSAFARTRNIQISSI